MYSSRKIGICKMKINGLFTNTGKQIQIDTINIYDLVV